eukprot:TRINITY_DN9786_c0_g1_i1.p1 TRINITY_DN9786_c0_g1~~TRINITY_DN9786_c0_g1_i1.p1  ORF type:complete len:717 (-),score=151.63 TRINITY_DN9786_c0_g1_i1:9-2159(-)
MLLFCPWLACGDSSVASSAGKEQCCSYIHALVPPREPPEAGRDERDSHRLLKHEKKKEQPFQDSTTSGLQPRTPAADKQSFQYFNLPLQTPRPPPVPNPPESPRFPKLAELETFEQAAEVPEAPAPEEVLHSGEAADRLFISEAKASGAPEEALQSGEAVDRLSTAEAKVSEGPEEVLQSGEAVDRLSTAEAKVSEAPEAVLQSGEAVDRLSTAEAKVPAAPEEVSQSGEAVGRLSTAEAKVSEAPEEVLHSGEAVDRLTISEAKVHEEAADCLLERGIFRGTGGYIDGYIDGFIDGRAERQIPKGDLEAESTAEGSSTSSCSNSRYAEVSLPASCCHSKSRPEGATTELAHEGAECGTQSAPTQRFYIGDDDPTHEEVAEVKESSPTCEEQQVAGVDGKKLEGADGWEQIPEVQERHDDCVRIVDLMTGEGIASLEISGAETCGAVIERLASRCQLGSNEIVLVHENQIVDASCQVLVNSELGMLRRSLSQTQVCGGDRDGGKGWEVLDDNSFFIGSYVDGKMHGNGKHFWTNGSTYVGEFRAGKKAGEGTFRYKDGHWYEGQWVNDCQHGRGRCEWPDGRYYEGNFVKDVKEGEGVFAWADGRKFTGTWKADRQHGVGVFRAADGVESTGEWQQGFRLRSLDRAAASDSSPRTETRDRWEAWLSSRPSKSNPRVFVTSREGDDSPLLPSSPSEWTKTRTMPRLPNLNRHVFSTP